MEERFLVESRPQCIMIKLPEGIFELPEEYKKQDVHVALYQDKDSYGAVILDEKYEPIMETLFGEIEEGVDR